ncbi:MAG: DNA primase [Armatimonadetes bacterium]|nr:DNA primase [Armatimonadota bacterium]MDW8029727.1 DNA primase [Armatimonadota bacterium]
MSETNIVRLIREQANIVEVVGAYVRLLPAGKNYKALCPFHQEKTPSFFVSPEKGLWHCFGCGSGGDVIDFVQRIEGLTFIETVAKLARQLGIRWQPSVATRREEWARERLLQLNHWAVDFFERVLWASEFGEKARLYLFQRQVGTTTARLFRLGYAPASWDAMAKAAREKGFQIGELLQAGLVQKVRDSSEVIDRFRDRLIFPIFNPQGEPIGFGGRILSEGEPKYLNTPETPLFQKRKVLYALNLALKSIREKGEVILVEGYMDTISLHQAGFTNTVATMGTAINADTIQILKRYTNRIIVAYDSDSSGLNAILRSADLFRMNDMEVRFLDLPEGSDPDSFVREFGSNGFKELLERAQSLTKFRATWLVKRYPSDSSEGLQAAVKLLASLTDPIEQRACLQLLAKEWSGNQPEKMGNLEQVLNRALIQYLREQQPKASQLNPSKTFDPIATSLTSTSVIPQGILQAEQDLMAAIVQDKDSARKILSVISPEEFFLSKHQELARIAKACLEDETFSELTNLVAELGDEDLRQTLSGLLLRDLSFLKAKNAIEDRVQRLRRYRLENLLRHQRAELLRKLTSGQISRDDPTWKAWQEALRTLKT